MHARIARVVNSLHAGSSYDSVRPILLVESVLELRPGFTDSETDMTNRSTARSVGSCTIALTLLIAGGPSASAAEATIAGPPEFGWEVVHSGLAWDPYEVAAVSNEVAWFAMFYGPVMRTIDGGASLVDVTPNDVTEPSHHDLWARNADEALLLVTDREDGVSSIYRTKDGGATWSEAYTSPAGKELGYLAMFDDTRGFAVSHESGRRAKKLRFITTSDAGATWARVDPKGIPTGPTRGELVYSAAATTKAGFVGTQPRSPGSGMYRTSDYGITWESVEVPLYVRVSSIDFRTRQIGLAAGGTGSDFGIARTRDGGQTWEPFGPDGLEDVPLSDVDWWEGPRGLVDSPLSRRTVILSGQHSYASVDRGQTWKIFDGDLETFRVDCASGGGGCWAATAGHAVARLRVS